MPYDPSFLPKSQLPLSNIDAVVKIDKLLVDKKFLEKSYTEQLMKFPYSTLDSLPIVFQLLYKFSDIIKSREECTAIIQANAEMQTWLHANWIEIYALCKFHESNTVNLLQFCQLPVSCIASNPGVDSFLVKMMANFYPESPLSNLFISDRRIISIFKQGFRISSPKDYECLLSLSDEQLQRVMGAHYLIQNTGFLYRFSELAELSDDLLLKITLLKPFFMRHYTIQDVTITYFENLSSEQISRLNKFAALIQKKVDSPIWNYKALYSKTELDIILADSFDFKLVLMGKHSFLKYLSIIELHDFDLTTLTGLCDDLSNFASHFWDVDITGLDYDDWEVVANELESLIQSSLKNKSFDCEHADQITAKISQIRDDKFGINSNRP
jgi:hypothetical protein